MNLYQAKHHLRAYLDQLAIVQELDNMGEAEPGWVEAAERHVQHMVQVIEDMKRGNHDLYKAKKVWSLQ
jgi:hypothetical protein